jgi:hypothetical protein
MSTAPYVPEKLKEVANRLGQGEQPTATVRELLSWFWSSQRRGQFIVFAIRSALHELSIQTVPDFNLTYIDAQITFLPSTASPPASVTQSAPTTETDTSVAAEASASAPRLR